MASISMSSILLGGGINVVKLGGNLDVFNSAALMNFIEELCAETKGMNMVVDLTQVAHISSAGWSLLVSRRRTLRLMGGDLSIFGLGENVSRVYESMKIQRRLPCGANVGEAVALLSGHSLL